MQHAVNAAGRLDRLPISRFHWKILGLIAGGAFLDAFDIYLANGSVAAMVKEGFTDLHHGAMFVSSTFVGMMLGAFIAGWLGRRYSYQLNLAVFGLASIAACFAPNIESLIGLRFIMGLGLGAELVVAAGTLAEFVPPATRGKWVSLLASITNSGLFAALAAGYWVIPNLGWRYMFALAGVGALVVWFLRHRMPESPRWLESVGRLDEAEATLAAIEREVSAQMGQLPPVQRAVDLNKDKAPQAVPRSRTSSLKPATRKNWEATQSFPAVPRGAENFRRASSLLRAGPSESRATPGPTYQRNNRGPSHAPSAAGNNMPIAYQMLQNAGLISGQCTQ
ncbi:Sialic acid transporter NanT [Paraburkholderia caffeinitolerans]|uniref:Sialic acid transporter NanT n=1 Tax=Paraburkholderia caffeinitolerans TaxID=1723730 RepID=A0A6J5GKN0_9BURK|nr:Sialic acid transporter NanT [Paraburkholderia caffeinitolerans]